MINKIIQKIKILPEQKNEKTETKYSHLRTITSLNRFCYGIMKLKKIFFEQIKYQKANITIDDIIMTIPKKLMLNVKKSLELLNSSKLKKDYEAYLKDDKESQKKRQTIFDEAHIDQSFLSYILYIISHKKKKYSKIILKVQKPI